MFSYSVVQRVLTMSLTALTLVLTVFAVHAAPSGNPPGALNGNLDRFNGGHQCLLRKHIAEFQKDLIHGRAFVKKIPAYVEEAHKAFKNLQNLIENSPDACNLKLESEAELTNALDVVLGAYALISPLNDKDKKEYYEDILLPNWNYLPAGYGKAQRLIKEGHYCENENCAKLETLYVIDTPAEQGNLTESVVREEVRRVQDVVHGQCTKDQLEKENLCGYYRHMREY